MLVKIKGIHKVKRKQADGSVHTHYYAWRGGPKIKAKPHTEAFAAEHAEHKKAVDQQRPLMLADLIDQFTGSEKEPNPDFITLAESTRRDHSYAFGIIKREWPRLNVKLTQQRGFKAVIRKWHRSFAANPRKADKLLFSLSKVFSYAVADELIERNPCTGISRMYEGSRKDSVWTPDQIALFRSAAPTHLALAFEMAVRTGQRQGDLLAASWKQYDETHLTFWQSKGKKNGAGGKRVKVRVHSELKALMDALPRDKMRILLNSRGRPWTSDGFKTSWGKACDKLGIDDVTFHDLRGTFITEARREGSTAEQIASVSGHSISEVTGVLEKHYLADDQVAADAVILRMDKNR